MTPTEKADRAQQLLDDPLLAEVLAGMREKLVARLESCPISDTEQQRDITVTLQLLRQMPEGLRRFVNDGQVLKYRAEQDEFLAKTRQRL